MTYPHNGILFNKKKSAKCAIKCDILIHERSYKKIGHVLLGPVYIRNPGG